MAFCQVERLRTIVCIISWGFFQKAPGIGAATTILSKNCPIFGRVVSIVNDLHGLLCLMFCQCRVTEFLACWALQDVHFRAALTLPVILFCGAHEGPIGANVSIPAHRMWHSTSEFSASTFFDHSASTHLFHGSGFVPKHHVRRRARELRCLILHSFHQGHCIHLCKLCARMTSKPPCPAFQIRVLRHGFGRLWPPPNSQFFAFPSAGFKDPVRTFGQMSLAPTSWFSRKSASLSSFFLSFGRVFNSFINWLQNDTAEALTFKGMKSLA